MKKQTVLGFLKQISNYKLMLPTALQKAQATLFTRRFLVAFCVRKLKAGTDRTNLRVHEQVHGWMIKWHECMCVCNLN